MGIKVKELKKVIKKHTILEGITCQLDEGVYGVLGPNGAGKTTFLRCLSGLYPIEQGVILYEEESIAKNQKYHKEIGYLPQNFGALKELRVTEMLEYYADLKNVALNKNKEEINQILEIVNLQEQQGKKVGQLSGGMLRRLGIAQALIGNPRVLLLDEPTVGLDVEERIRFKEIIKQIKRDKIILISTHIVEDIEGICDQVLIMDEGRVLIQTPYIQVKELARNKVYEIAHEACKEIKGDYYIEKTFVKDDKMYVRLLSNEAVDGKKVEPMLEDGYLWILKNK